MAKYLLIYRVYGTCDPAYAMTEEFKAASRVKAKREAIKTLKGRHPVGEIVMHLYEIKHQVC